MALHAQPGEDVQIRARGSTSAARKRWKKRTRCLRNFAPFSASQPQELHLFQSAFVELDQVEICADILPVLRRPLPSRNAENALSSTAVSGCREIIASIPFFDLLPPNVSTPFSSIHFRIAWSSSSRSAASSKASGFSSRSEQMFVEPDGLVVVAVKQTFAMQLRLVDQARQMHVTAEPFVRTPRKELCALTATMKSRAMAAATRQEEPASRSNRLARGQRGQQFALCQFRLPDHELSGKHSAFFD